MMSRNDACQNLSGRLWRHIFYNWRQRPTFFTQLFSMIKFSNAWYLLWSNHGCFILLSVLPVLDYLPSFISSSQLQGFLVADTWQFMCMKDVSQWAGHGLDHPSVSSVCMDSQNPSGRKGPHEALVQEGSEPSSDHVAQGYVHLGLESLQSDNLFVVTSSCTPGGYSEVPHQVTLPRAFGLRN